MVIVVGGFPVLDVGLFDPIPGVVLLDADADVGSSALDAVALSGEIAWITGTDAVALTDTASRAEMSGIALGRVVLEPEPAGIEALAREGFVVACAPDRFGFGPGGPLEAAVAAAVIHGAQLVRTAHVRTARRCMDVALALLAERARGTVPPGANA